MMSKSSCLFCVVGGPGSRKGRIVDDLVNSYGLSFIRGEDLLLAELPKKLQNVIKLETSKEIQEFVRVKNLDVAFYFLV